MVRFSVLLYNMVGVLFLNFLFFNNVTLEMKAPDVVVAGEEFEVEVTVKKGFVNSFARFQANLPAGLTAEAVESKYADFTFDEKRVRLMWLRLPSDETFTFKYKVKVDERLKGDFYLGGKFSFIDNNERRSIDLKPQLIFIEPSPLIDESLVIDIDEFESLVIENLNPTVEKKVVCVRQVPEIAYNKDEVIIRLLVNKEDKEKFAKIEEIVPDGFTAISIDTKDGIFTFKDGMAKFLWMNLPSERYFVVSYKLIPVEGTTVQDIDLEGVFSYIEEDRTIPIKILQRPFNIDELTPVAVESILSSLPSTEELITDPLIRKIIDDGQKEDSEKVIPVVLVDTSVTLTNVVDTQETHTVTETETTSVSGVDPVTVEPVTVEPVTYFLRVVNGKGSGEYEEGEVITVTANQPGENTEFDYWSGDNQYLKNASSSVSELTMPGKDVNIKAVYKEIEIIEPVVTENKGTKLKYTESDLPNLLEPEEGVYYRVQLAAGHRPVNIEWYFKRLNIQDDVRTEIHDNWIKYSIGSYNMYKEARDYRVHIWNTTPVDDAFVAAYNDGVRITVQEALMIANQKWYK